MNRRDWFRTWGAAGALATTTAAKDTPAATALEAKVVRLNLRHTWTTTMSSSEYRDTLHVSLRSGGIIGRGEGAPIVRYHETAAEGQKVIESLAPYLAKADLRSYNKILSDVSDRVEGQWAMKSALDIALMDWNAKRLGTPLCRMLGLDPADTPLTTFSIGIDTPEVTRKKVEEAAPFPVLKIKVGLEKDRATIEAVRSVTNKPLRVDANEGFKTKEEALEKINWLATQNVEFIEQPMPAAMLEEQRWLRSRARMPIFADESCLHPEDISRVADAYDGLVVKLDKAGGTQRALDMIRIARAFKLKVMIGCMVSSSVTITAAAHLSPLCDFADLDGNLLIANDPFRGVTVRNGKLVLPDRPGLGLQPA